MYILSNPEILSKGPIARARGEFTRVFSATAWSLIC